MRQLQPKMRLLFSTSKRVIAELRFDFAQKVTKGLIIDKPFYPTPSTFSSRKVV